MFGESPDPATCKELELAALRARVVGLEEEIIATRVHAVLHLRGTAYVLRERGKEDEAKVWEQAANELVSIVFQRFPTLIQHDRAELDTESAPFQSGRLLYLQPRRG